MNFSPYCLGYLSGSDYSYQIKIITLTDLSNAAKQFASKNAHFDSIPEYINGFMDAVINKGKADGSKKKQLQQIER